MNKAIKIRGIYTTAFTRLFLDSDYRIAEPSPEIRQRFKLSPTARAADILLKDREDRQGVDILGEPEGISTLLKIIQENLIDATLMNIRPLDAEETETLEELRPSGELARAWLELGGASKGKLDDLRSTVIPTLARHHRLRIVQAALLEKAEKRLEERPELKKKLEKEVFQEAILFPLSKAAGIRLEHLKVRDKPVRPREGVIWEAKETRVLIKRSFSRGRYDGLDLPIEEGDYGLTEVQEGAWAVKHRYFSKDGKLKGEYFNINTPVELYPHGARYIDLEIDVVRRAGESPVIVDREDLALLVKEGKISRKMEQKAMETAEQLLKRI
ncbi:MAG: DUF402 domain-containing protein [Syntrophaceae bacterium]|nr:DUF402 domain-containing protein [Syntrophaceae bacterium]